MSVTIDSGHPRLVEAQRVAIEKRVGMWAHGVPNLYSPHYTLSMSARTALTPTTGLCHLWMVTPKKWMHQNKYTECQTVCEQDIQISESNLATLRNALIKIKTRNPSLVITLKAS